MRKFRGEACLGSDYIEFEVPDDATDEDIERAAHKEASDYLRVNYREVGKPDPSVRGSGPLSEILSTGVIERFLKGSVGS